MKQSNLQLQKFKVYVRWRPLIVNESQVAEIKREYPESGKTKTQSVSISALSNTNRPSKPWKSNSSFCHIFEHDADNEHVFETVVTPTLPQVLSGSTCNFFAYGHSGSGKTHTIIGYEFEDKARLGLCLAAARDLFVALDELNAAQRADPEDNNQGWLGVGVRLYELRKKSAFDLFNNHNECFVRQGEDGQTHIRGETEMLEGGKVRVRPIMTRPCWTFEELKTQLLAGLKLRATGTSTTHDQSSRTHAVLELEVVNKALLDAHDLVIERQSELVPVGKRATDIYLEESMKSLMKDADGKWVPNPACPRNDERVNAAEAEKKEFEDRVKAAEDAVQDVFASCPHACLGGKFVFVDLAGSEYYSEGKGTNSLGSKQTLQEQQEGRQINADLFALKEVIRARALNQSRIPFRSAPLTMALREHFMSAENSSSAMILTISPSSEQYLATMNTLKYGNLVGVASKDG